MQLEMRPPVQDLVFQLYGRHLHPEFFDILASRTVERENYKLHVRVTSTGHWITFEHPEMILSEVAGANNQEFPDSKRLVDLQLRQGYTGKLELAHNIFYEHCFQVEHLGPEAFPHIHKEIVADGRKRGLIHHFRTASRFALPALGFVTADARDGCIVIATFHTFPGEYTVVKTQSLIERR